MAQAMRQFLEGSSKVASGSASAQEQATFRAVPKVAGRPAWVSMLTEEERTVMDKAYKFLQEQSKPKAR
jgi:hypothetical protein